jgi:hypothetical protein
MMRVRGRHDHLRRRRARLHRTLNGLHRLPPADRIDRGQHDGDIAAQRQRAARSSCTDAARRLRQNRPKDQRASAGVIVAWRIQSPRP